MLTHHRPESSSAYPKRLTGAERALLALFRGYAQRTLALPKADPTVRRLEARGLLRRRAGSDTERDGLAAFTIIR